ncbi:hypothetical protein PCE1_003505 [Barthelona sp. PCE]
MEAVSSAKVSEGFRTVKLNFSLFASPVFLPKNISLSINEALNNRILTYSADIGGIVLTYNNVRVLSSYSRYVDESPFLHIKGSCECLIFMPDNTTPQLNALVEHVDDDRITAKLFDVFTVNVTTDKLTDYTHKYVGRGEMFEHNDDADVRIEEGSVIGIKCMGVFNEEYEEEHTIIIEGEFCEFISAPEVRESFEYDDDLDLGSGSIFQKDESDQESEGSSDEDYPHSDYDDEVIDVPRTHTMKRSSESEPKRKMQAVYNETDTESEGYSSGSD